MGREVERSEMIELNHVEVGGVLLPWMIHAFVEAGYQGCTIVADASTNMDFVTAKLEEQPRYITNVCPYCTRRFEERIANLDVTFCLEHGQYECRHVHYPHYKA